MATDMVEPTKMMVTPVRLSTRPNWANRMNNGITAVTTGSDCTTNNTKENPETSLLRPRDNTYPAGAATATDTRTVARVTVMLLRNQVATSVWMKMLTKFSRVNFAVLVLPSAGWRESPTTAKIGTRATRVITKRTRNLHQRPRVSGSGLLGATGATHGTAASTVCEIPAVVLIGSAPS